MPSVTIEGKPRIFFSDNAPDEPWRLKEKVVSVIESYFQGVEDLYIFSSKRIPNVVGEPVEVDVAYTGVSDPTTVFEFIQIRDRQEIAGRPWVEQLLGQRTSFGLNAGIMVSTNQFSGNAVRLAKKFNIPLRLLLPETAENIKQWYISDTIGIQSPIIEISFCSILAKAENMVLEFKADRNKCIEDNILVATGRPHNYRVISLARVFDVDVMQNDIRREELLTKIPADNTFHKATLAIQYNQPRLYLKRNLANPSGGDSTKEIQPISAIIFFIQAKYLSLNMPITYRYRYLDATNKKCLAQAIIAEFDMGNQRNYICLVRHNIDGDNRNLGGAFFH